MSEPFLKSLTEAVAEPIGRRGFIVTTLAAGFAAAAEPLMAQAILTSAEGLVAGEVKVPSLGVEIPAYAAMPATGGPFPTILVIQEIFGVHEHIRDVCRRFAKLGYYAIAPELYARQGDVSKYTDIPKLIAEVVSKVPDAQVASDLDASVAFAKASGKADVSKLGVIGFCWGGRQTWLYAAHNPALKAAVALYGPLGGMPNPLQPKTVAEIADTIKVPVMGLYGAQDSGIPQEQVNALREKLKAGTSGSEINVYPNSGHAFFADYRPSYRKADAEDAWVKIQAWFKGHGVA